jgi:DNA polymerase-3 subunit delta'
LSFDPLSDDIVMRLLKKDDPDMADRDIKILAQLSDGSIGQALRLKKEGGIALYKKMIDMIATAPNIDRIKIHEWSDKLGRAGAEQSYQTTMQLFCWWLAGIARAQSRGDMPTAIIEGEDVIIAKLTALYTAKQWLDIWDHVNQIVVQTDRARLDRRQAVLSSFEALAG